MLKSSGSILGRILEPVSDSLNDAAARKLLSLKADPQASKRVAVLARKCNRGSLNPQERTEYEQYVLAGELVALLQARARTLLEGSRAC